MYLKIIKKNKNLEAQYNKDINALKNIIMQKNEETEKIVNKYENKFILVNIFLILSSNLK